MGPKLLLPSRKWRFIVRQVRHMELEYGRIKRLNKKQQ